MTISILTLFPEIFPPVLNASIIGRAQKKNIVTVRYVNIRDFATDTHKTVDDKPYGGGAGMVMRVDVIERAISATENRKQRTNNKERVVLLDPKGKVFKQSTARRFSTLDQLILVCGHYEGVDARVSHFIDETLSIGDYILTGGELPAMVVLDAVVRQLPGTLKRGEAIVHESFTKKHSLEWPQYTRPGTYKGFTVPDVLLSGNTKRITAWKEENSTWRKPS